MRTLSLAALLLVGLPLIPQDPQPPAAAPRPAPAARPADVASIEAVIAALYDVVSGPAGQARGWERMRSLFLPQARLMPLVKARGGRGMRALC